jgi:putative tryptophan/tyrosine transport system substrate-binding protein
MRRRDFIGLLGGAVASRPLPTFAQTSSKRPLIAAQVGGSKTGADRYFSGFSQGMRELGYVEGHDYGFEVRYAEGNASRIPLLIEELVGLKPDIIVSGTMAGVIAAKKLTDTIPIVSVVLTNHRVRRGGELCPAWRQCNRRIADRGGLANQAVGTCS